jgi:hypothetical protein
MPIAMNRYVEITSGVAGAALVPQRELIGRIFSENLLIPTDTVLEFESADDVGDYFGTSSEEYDRAVFYFGWVSPNITAPQKISFARWNSAAVGSTIYGAKATYSLSTLTAISSGNLTMEFGGFEFAMTTIDLSGAASLAAVAALIQTKIRAQTGGGAAWTSATVTFDAVRGSFNFASGATGNDTITVTASSSPDVAAALGWLTGAILSNGNAAQAIDTLLSENAERDDNFGSFCFIPELTTDEIVDAAEWNDTQNVRFMYSQRVTASNAAAVSAAVYALSGVGLTLAPIADEYPEMCPMIVLAATNYLRRNSTFNYMFKTNFDLTPSVTTNADATTYDAQRVNYYGQTQSAGTNLSFYQRGYLMGGSTDAKDMNTYANELWLKSAAQNQLITLLLALAKVSANRQGAAQINATLQSVIELALFNGTISVGKPLDNTQKLYITNATGEDLAWQQVQNAGYWLGITFESVVVNDGTEWKATYLLIYSKDDVIRKIEGTHSLI